jgi:hypothetical protein
MIQNNTCDAFTKNRHFDRPQPLGRELSHRGLVICRDIFCALIENLCEQFLAQLFPLASLNREGLRDMIGTPNERMKTPSRKAEVDSEDEDAGESIGGPKRMVRADVGARTDLWEVESPDYLLPFWRNQAIR